MASHLNPQPNIALYRGFQGSGVYIWSPFVTKLEARLRFAGISYRTEAGSLSKAPRGKIPYLANSKASSGIQAPVTPTILADSTLISEKLVEEGVLNDLNARLSPTQKAHDLAIWALLEDKLYFYQNYERWHENYYTMQSHILSALPYPVQLIVGLLAYRKVTQTHKLAEYAAKWWIGHAQAAEQDTRFIHWEGVDLTKTLVDGPGPLYYASLLGLPEMLRLWIDNAHTDINVQGGQFDNALQVASANGHEVVTKMLLEAGADFNLQGEWYGNALEAASHRGHEKVVKLLLKAGADVNAQSGRHDTALYEASYRGHEKVVKLLLKAEADVNAQGGWLGNAVEAASTYGREKVVKLLLEAGAQMPKRKGHSAE